VKAARGAASASSQRPRGERWLDAGHALAGLLGGARDRRPWVCERMYSRML